ncbi:ANTAR domain-containing protein [Kutzneria sp. CA-103260]|uniref:ANTAR domain-containing protein n=1 Tax=Kutzneria sp. CA-103260 TaxID=2802641 RepID=UPI001BACEC8B|nr:ANTAR domain-containing protein [Kutzneria sp. CA-103260]QUQ72572.1 ANTAR domain-containing protein [Kutzneria sp. CA-103260]
MAPAVSDSRDHVPTRMLAQFTEALARAGSIAHLTRLLTDMSRTLLEVPAAGVLLYDRAGRPAVDGSPEDKRFAPLFALQAKSGPTLECYHAGQSVVLTRESAIKDGWPDLAAAMGSCGVNAIEAVPLRTYNSAARGETVGALTLFCEAQTTVARRRLQYVVQGLANFGLTAVTLRQDASLSTELAGKLRDRVRQNTAIEQAKGLLAGRLRINIAQATALLTAVARDQDLPLHQVAHDVLTGKTDLSD